MNIGYHTRLYASNTVKVTGGSFSGKIDQETVERLASTFSVVVKNSGTAVFVDREGREVRLYISVDVDSTEVGKKALRAHALERERNEAEREFRAAREAKEIEDAMNGLPREEIIARLKNEAT